MKIYYWSPHISKVATIKAVLNSAFALKKFSKNKIQTQIINAFGEWDIYKREVDEKEIDLINFSNKKLASFGNYNSFFKSRLKYILICLNWSFVIRLNDFLIVL